MHNLDNVSSLGKLEQNNFDATRVNSPRATPDPLGHPPKGNTEEHAATKYRTYMAKLYFSNKHSEQNLVQYFGILATSFQNFMNTNDYPQDLRR